MAHAVDHPSGKKRDPGHLHRPHGDARYTEEHEINHQHQRYTDQVEAPIHLMFDPVIWRAVRIACDQAFAPGRLLVQFGPLPQHLVQAEDLRAMWVLRCLAARMVTAVHRDPFTGDHPSRQPKPKTKKMCRKRVQIERAVRLASMQINGNRNDGHVGQSEDDKYQLPPGKAEQSSSHISLRRT